MGGGAKASCHLTSVQPASCQASRWPNLDGQPNSCMRLPMRRLKQPCALPPHQTGTLAYWCFHWPIQSHTESTPLGHGYVHMVTAPTGTTPRYHVGCSASCSEHLAARKHDDLGPITLLTGSSPAGEANASEESAMGSPGERPLHVGGKGPPHPSGSRMTDCPIPPWLPTPRQGPIYPEAPPLSAGGVAQVGHWRRCVGSL